ncbi:hypothetical protein BC830DRAFT_1096917 [Chytriomyces sp. MP71]|nr:hypothetical protein BC830DRAFT_1096917 [Chytriomyces sp. MP71]
MGTQGPQLHNGHHVGHSTHTQLLHRVQRSHVEAVGSGCAQTNSLKEDTKATPRQGHTQCQAPVPTSVHFRPSRCGAFTVVAETHLVPLDESGHAKLPMDRRCLVRVYERVHTATAAVLFIHGFAGNRHMFDFGGGTVRHGPSFIEYFAKRGFDAYSLDLRGTRESESHGARAPASITEHIEVDVPSALRYIQRLGHEKVYLIGHSMGGAVSCAVAGAYPNLVAGVVHLAGLYNFTFLIIGDAVDLYHAATPRILQNALSAGTNLALRAFWPLLHPTLNTISSLLGAESPQPTAVPSLLAAARYTTSYARRSKIPLRPAMDAFMCLRRYFPQNVTNAIMNRIYPSPWFPHSLNDPVTMADISLESPTLGVCLSVGKRALKWLDANHSKSAIRSGGPDYITPEMAGGSSTSASYQFPAPPSSNIRNEINASSPVIPGLQGWDELGPYFDRFERLEHMPVFFCPANADQILRNADTMAGYERSGSKWKDSILYHPPTASGPTGGGSAAPLRIEIGRPEDSSIRALAASLPSPAATESLKRVYSGTHIPRSTLFHRATSNPSSTAHTGAALGGERYRVPAGRQFGHIDIMGGEHAEEVWKRIADWMDVTAGREREWRFSRRFSAK